jgi:hypothetical protein
MQNKSLDERIIEFKKELSPLLIKYHLKFGAIIDFPQYKIVPDEVTLSVNILNKHGAEFRTIFKEADDKK